MCAYIHTHSKFLLPKKNSSLICLHFIPPPKILLIFTVIMPTFCYKKFQKMERLK